MVWRYILTGTDEHGLKIQRAAEKKGIEPLKFCDEISQTFRSLSKLLNLTNTDFIRTTEKDIFCQFKIYGINLKMMTSIFQNILGTLFQMKHFIQMMKLRRLMDKNNL